MNIAIIGTRGIPNEYGGFEQFAEHFSVYAAQQGHSVTVYCSSLHSYKNDAYKNVRLVHCYDAEDKIGTAGQFIYDLNCILHARKEPYDVIIQLGYTSSSIWNFLFRKDVFVATNMDGMEWLRTKYNKLTQQFLKHAEKWAANSSDLLIADSPVIEQYLLNKYATPVFYAAYGATLFNGADSSIITEYDVQPMEYDLLVARMEPENHIEMIIKGHLLSGASFPLLVIGNIHNKFGKYLQSTYQSGQIRFLQGIYDIQVLNNLRYFARMYFHGHSVGGTNPSLLEAMASGAYICAHDNLFNRSVLNGNARYFKTEEDVARCIDEEQSQRDAFISNNNQRILSEYNWDAINQSILDKLNSKLNERR